MCYALCALQCLHFLYSTLLGLLGHEIDLISTSIDFTRRLKFCSPMRAEVQVWQFILIFIDLILVHLRGLLHFVNAQSAVAPKLVFADAGR